MRAELNHLLGSVCHWQLSINNWPVDDTHPQKGHTPEFNCVSHTPVPSPSFAERRRGQVIWMLYVPTPKSLWCSLGYDHLSLLIHTFWLLTYRLPKLVKLSS